MHPPSTTTYPLSLHDALPIFGATVVADLRDEHERRIGADDREVHVLGTGNAEQVPGGDGALVGQLLIRQRRGGVLGDRKSTRLNSSHLGISYAVFCLKKKTTA